jgi:hypothetical protein
MKLLACSLFALLSGCVVIQDDAMFMAKTPEPQTRQIMWLKTDNPAAICNMPANTEACARWSGNRCTVITKPGVYYHVFGHELRHCFEGPFHD